MPLTFKIDHEKRFVQIDTDGVVTLGAWVSTFAQRDPRRPIALPYTNEEDENTFRRYMNLGGAKRPIKLFKSRTRAMKWLSGGSEA